MANVLLNQDKVTGQYRSQHRLMATLVAAIHNDPRPTYQIAEAARVSPGTVYKWLDGDTFCPRMDTACKVAEALGMEVDIRPVASNIH
jgi:DNA-binding phage protein